MTAVLGPVADLDTRRKTSRRVLEIIGREDLGYIGLRRSTLLYGKRKDIAWTYSGLYLMDSAPGNLAFGK